MLPPSRNVERMSGECGVRGVGRGMCLGERRSMAISQQFDLRLQPAPPEI
jgi:hypothetical protein